GRGVRNGIRVSGGHTRHPPTSGYEPARNRTDCAREPYASGGAWRRLSWLSSAPAAPTRDDIPSPLGESAVPGENLTRSEAQERRAVIDTQSYEVSLDLTKGAEVFGSRSVVRFTATPGGFTFIDLIARDVREITLNGEQIDPSTA